MKIERIVIVFFVAALIAVSASVYYAYQNFTTGENSGAIARHTHRVIEAVYQVEFQVTEVENASDKYLISGKPYYATLATLNASTLNNNIQALQDSVKDNPDEVKRVGEFATLVGNMEDELPALGDTGKAGIKTYFINHSKGLTDNSIYAIIAKANEIISEESRLLEVRRNTAVEAQLKTIHATYYIAAASLGFILLILYGFNRGIRKRREAEARIRENEEKLRNMFEEVGDVIYSSDYKGKLTFINSRLGILTGYTTEELMGKHFSFLVHPDWVEKVRGFYAQQHKDRIYETRYEFPIITKQGETRWVEQNVVMASHVRSNAEGKQGETEEGFQCVVRDITERKNTEEEVRRTSQFLDSVLDNIPDMIFVKDAGDLRFLRFNKAGEMLLGYTQNELLGKNDYDLFPKAQADFFSHKDREVISGHKGIDIPEEPIKTKHGSRWLHTKKIPVSDAEGKPIYLLGISEDITEKKKAEDTIVQLNKSLARYVAELEESQLFYKTLARNFPDGVIVVLDRNLNYLFADGLELELRGLESENMPGTPYLNEFPESDKSAIKNKLMLVFKGTNTSFETTLWENNYMIHGAPLQSALGVVDEILVVMQNITKLKRAEEDTKTALEKEKLTNEMKSRFVSLASHEFRTPLSTILSSSELIGEYVQHDGQDGARMLEKNLFHLKRIRTAVQNMVGILNGFLSLDQLEQGKTVTSPKEFDVNEFSAEVMEEVHDKLKTGQEIKFSCVASSPRIFTDRSILKNVVLNLLTNAIKYSPENSAIKYSTLVSNEGIEITVEDRGIGIPETEQANLFERFFRAKNTQAIEGTGLGLNIVKKYIDLLKGSISFTSLENEGSIFKVFVANTITGDENNFNEEHEVYEKNTSY